MICPYCNKKAIWCSNENIYGRAMGVSHMCYYCRDCDAYVGCHKNTRNTLGTMANKELRGWRQKAHFKIDPFWKEHGWMRSHVYEYMTMMFGYEVHVGSSDIDLCKAILELEFPTYKEFLKAREL